MSAGRAPAVAAEPARLVLVAAMVLSGALFSASAHAGVVSTEARTFSNPDSDDTVVRTLRFRAGAGERNDAAVAFSTDGKVTVRDTAGVTAGAGCTQAGATLATCTSDPAGRIDLGDRDDALRITGHDATAGIPVSLCRTDLAVVVSDGAGNDAATGGGGSEHFLNDAGDDVLRGGGATDRLAGGPGADTLEGGSGDDEVCYSTRRSPVRADLDGRRDDGARGERDRIGRDVENLAGGRGPDRLAGNAWDNELQGGPGDDRLVGGRGGDALSGGGGNDRLKTVDRHGDFAACGRGRDTLRADRSDSGAGCERRELIGPLVARLRTPDTAVVRRGRARIPVSCPRASGTCRGSVTLFEGGRRIAHARFRVGAGSTRGVSLRLNPLGRRRLRRFELLEAGVVLRAKVSRATYVTEEHTTLELPG